MVLKANDRRTSCPCHDEFRGPRSDYVRQVALATTTTQTQWYWVRTPDMPTMIRYLDHWAIIALRIPDAKHIYNASQVDIRSATSSDYHRNRRCSRVYRSSSDTDGQRIVGRVKANPGCCRCQLKQRRSIPPPTSYTQAISGGFRRNPRE
ncbi:hypothetical protein TNCV_245601 [Trichonephila clavipes]|nr:hypothetical protein TNCV_245601 [Trichonephila clavipes]